MFCARHDRPEKSAPGFLLSVFSFSEATKFWQSALDGPRYISNTLDIAAKRGMTFMSGMDAATVFSLRGRKRQVCRRAIHALCIFIGAQLFLAAVANAQQAASADQAVTFLQDSLRQWGYFKPRDANLPNIKFYCVCGPYRTCKQEAQRLAERLEYRLPQYDYAEGLNRLRQRILFFLEHGQIVEIKIPYEQQLYFTLEHEGFCDMNLDKHIPRTREERNAD